MKDIEEQLDLLDSFYYAISVYMPLTIIGLMACYDIFLLSQAPKKIYMLWPWLFYFYVYFLCTMFYTLVQAKLN